MTMQAAVEPRKGAKSVLDRLCATWLDRAAVRSEEYEDEPLFDPLLYDFPPALLPFKSHPDYLALDEPVQRRVQAISWIAWNKRVVDTEELVVCKALLALLLGATDLKLKGATRTAIRHTLIDEAFHSHMHEVASSATIRQRGLAEALGERVWRPAYGYRSLCAATATMSERWEKEVARLVWAVVGELSIYEFLTLVSRDTSIQRGSRALLDLHERDECAHASVVAEVMRHHFHEFSAPQRRCFEACLPLAMDALSHQDWLVWGDILELAGVSAGKTIIEDTSHDRTVPDHLPLLRSYGR